jgi:hypothetical protein
MDIGGGFNSGVPAGEMRNVGGDVSAGTNEYWNPVGGELFVHSHFYEPSGDEQPMWGDPPSNYAIEIVGLLGDLEGAESTDKRNQAQEAILEGLKAITRSGNMVLDDPTRITVAENVVYGYRFDQGDDPIKFEITRSDGDTPSGKSA